jgi:uncharacterized protein (DUF2235 family)
MAKNLVVFSDGTGQDGGVRPEQRVSNVYKLYRSARVSFDTATDPNAQVTMYDPGLGTDIGATALTAPGRFVQKLLASVDGRGITRNIADCYEFIINHYEPGDRIFLFGFSRGAYTVRCVANLLRLCGVPTRTPEGPMKRFRIETRKIAEEATETVLEHGAGHPLKDFEPERDELARRFRAKYGSDDPDGMALRSNVAPYFIGVFDTVAALGAHGRRRAIIQTGLYSAVAVLTAIGMFLPAALLGLMGHRLFDASMWQTAFGLDGVATLGAILWFAYSQRRSIRKTIYDFPNKGDKHSHYARWEGKNFDRLLSRFVTYARSANAIDETRADFDRVPWGSTLPATTETAGHARFKQYFFAGNHSDIGGSYTEVESRLSDIPLAWMIEEAVAVPNGLKLGPVWVNGEKLARSGDTGPAIYLHPSEAGLQHSEIIATRDYLDSLKPAFLAWMFRHYNYAENVRTLPAEAVVHPSVSKRFALASVPQAAGSGAYRPEALRQHDEFRVFYEPSSTNIAPTAAPSSKPAGA